MLCSAISGGKTSGGAFYHSLAIPGSKPALWPGDDTGPGEGPLLPALESLEQTGYLGRGLADHPTKGTVFLPDTPLPPSDSEKEA